MFIFTLRRQTRVSQCAESKGRFGGTLDNASTIPGFPNENGPAVFQVAQYFNDKPRKKFIDFGEILKRTVVSSDDIYPAPPVKVELADPPPSMKLIMKQATARLNRIFTDNQ